MLLAYAELELNRLVFLPRHYYCHSISTAPPYPPPRHALSTLYHCSHLRRSPPGPPLSFLDDRATFARCSSQAPYTDPKSTLRYHNAEVYEVLKTFQPAVIQTYLAVRGQGVVLR